MQSVNVVTVQPGVGLLQASPIGTREWTSGLCDCTDDMTSCCIGAFFHTCLLAKISARLGDSMAVPWCVPNAPTVLRTRVRTLGGIQGSICDDCCMNTWCGPCVACQMSRELDGMGL